MSEKIQIIPYSTPDGIINLVPWENYEQLKRQLDNAIAVSRDRLLAAQNAEEKIEAMRAAIRDAHEALSQLDDCRIFHEDSMDIANGATDDCATARAKLQPFTES